MNWKELKDFCNSLTDEQMEKKVVLWRKHEVISNIVPNILQEDEYMDPEKNEGYFPESEASKPIENLKKVYDKGNPILFEI